MVVVIILMLLLIVPIGNSREFQWIQSWLRIKHTYRRGKVGVLTTHPGKREQIELAKFVDKPTKWKNQVVTRVEFETMFGALMGKFH